MTQQGEGVSAYGPGGVVRWIIDVVGGFALLGLGLLLVLVLFPELGVPLVLVGLGLLARHLAWEQRAPSGSTDGRTRSSTGGSGSRERRAL